MTSEIQGNYNTATTIATAQTTPDTTFRPSALVDYNTELTSGVWYRFGDGGKPFQYSVVEGTAKLTYGTLPEGQTATVVKDGGLVKINGEYFRLENPTSDGFKLREISADTVNEMNRLTRSDRSFVQTPTPGSQAPTNNSNTNNTVTPSTPEGKFLASLEKDSDLAEMRDIATFERAAREAGLKLGDAIKLRNDWYQSQKLKLEADGAQWAITKDKWAMASSIAKQLSDMGVLVVRSILEFKKAALESRLVDIAEDKEKNAYQLNKLMLEKEYGFRDSVIQKEKEIARLNASTEVQKARIAADVKKARDKSNALANLFGRRKYGYGSPAYA